jgi:hypothetical protein
VKKREWGGRLVLAAEALPILAAVLFWMASLQGVDPRLMTDLGLISIMPVWFYIALLMLSLSFIYQLFKGRNQALVLAHIATLILLLFGTPQLLYGTLRYAWTWKHIGIVDYILRHGGVDPTLSNLGGYQNWPGFFSFNALLTASAGLQSPLSYAGWGPVFFNLLDLGALVLIFQSLTSDKRLVWLGAWFFYLGNWIGQDYFSPQAMGFFFYLVIIGILLRWFRVIRPLALADIKQRVRVAWISSFIYKFFARSLSSSNPDNSLGRVQRAGLMAIAILFFAVIVSSHQLTPFMAISAIAALSLFQVSRIRRLAILFGVLTTAWIIFMALPFLKGNLYWIIRSIGKLLFSPNTRLSTQIQASAGQVLVADVARWLTALIVVLAIFGLLRRLHHRSWDLPAALLIGSPLLLLPANAYGGEMLFRVYFFALPFLAFCAAGLFFPALAKGRSIPARAAVFGASVLMLAGFSFAAYGREAMNYFTPNEVQAGSYLVQVAPPGSLLFSATWNYPSDFKNYESFQYQSIDGLDKTTALDMLEDPAVEIANKMKGYPDAFLILTRSQEIQVDLTNNLLPGSVAAIETAVRGAPYFTVIYSNPDAIILKLTPGVPVPPDTDDR